MKRTLQLSPVTSLAPWIADGDLVAFNIGPDAAIYLVVALKTLDYRTGEKEDASFAKTLPTLPQSYRVVAILGEHPILDVLIEEVRFNIHDVQPLADELLLVCARSCYKGPHDFEKNGRVYSRDGTFHREMLLGDGIQTVQTSSNGTIWTSFFDEGVFGNNPIGASGLVAWDAAGNKMYEFQPSDGLDMICDCYALNVESNECVWLYYYTDFPLVRLLRQRIDAVWNMPLSGSDAFAVSGKHCVFRGGYNHQDTYQLFSLGNHGQVNHIADIELRDTQGNMLVAKHIAARADTIHLICEDVLYRFDVHAACGVCAR